MERRMHPNNWKAGSASTKAFVILDCASRCIGYLPMRPGSIKSRIWFSILQRKCLQPNHFVSTTALEAALNEYIAYYDQTAKPINWTYTIEKLEHKLGAYL